MITYPTKRGSWENHRLKHAKRVGDTCDRSQETNPLYAKSTERRSYAKFHLKTSQKIPTVETFQGMITYPTKRGSWENHRLKHAKRVGDTCDRSQETNPLYAKSTERRSYAKFHLKTSQKIPTVETFQGMITYPTKRGSWENHRLKHAKRVGDTCDRSQETNPLYAKSTERRSYAKIHLKTSQKIPTVETFQGMITYPTKRGSWENHRLKHAKRVGDTCDRSQETNPLYAKSTERRSYAKFHLKTSQKTPTVETFQGMITYPTKRGSWENHRLKHAKRVGDTCDRSQETNPLYAKSTERRSYAKFHLKTSQKIPTVETFQGMITYPTKRGSWENHRLKHAKRVGDTCDRSQETNPLYAKSTERRSYAKFHLKTSQKIPTVV